MRSRSIRSTLVILLLWVAITGIDLNKAFHIDDTFHLKAAQWIEHHPGSPMSGSVNWGMDPEPLHNFNQPPGFFYLVAITGHLFGYSEVPMHLMRSLFSLLALLCFHRLALHRAPRHALWLTALFAFCPAFMVNQGLMTDVPLLAMQLLGFNFLLVPGSGSKGLRYFLAALAFSAAVFIKYTTLPVLVVFPLVLALRKDWKYMAFALVPFGLLALWSLWNVNEFGVAHILSREDGDRSLRGAFTRTLSIFTAIGAVSPFVGAIALGCFQAWRRWLWAAWLAVLIAFAAVAVLVYGMIMPEPVSDRLLSFGFTLNGLLLTGSAAQAMPWKKWRDTPDRTALALWACGLVAFLALFAPMMATRHILLVLPPILLLLAPAFSAAGAKARGLALALTAVLGVLLTISDKEYADFYRDMPPRIARDLGSGHTVWTVGHWGWQWYTAQVGMRTYAYHGEQPQAGDVMVVPEEYDAQFISPSVLAVPLRRYEAQPTLGTFFNVGKFGGMYTSSFRKLPWSLSRSHHKVIHVYRVVAHGGSPIVQEPFRR